MSLQHCDSCVEAQARVLHVTTLYNAAVEELAVFRREAQAFMVTESERYEEEKQALQAKLDELLYQVLYCCYGSGSARTTVLG